MKLLLPLVTLILSIANPAFPQDRPAQRPAQHRPFADAAQRLDQFRKLAMDIATDEQKEKLNEIFNKAQQKFITLAEEVRRSTPQRDEIARRMSAITDTLREDLSLLFTQQQRERVKQALENAGNLLVPPGAPPAGPGPMLDRIAEFLPQLNLSDDQRQKLRALREQSQEKMQKLRQEAAAGGQQARRELAELARANAQRIRELLTPQQEQKLRELMQGSPVRRPAQRPAAEAPVRPVPEIRAEQPSALVGQPAPALAFRTLEDRVTSLASFEGSVVVVEFGSLTCPTFRDKVDAMRQLQADYGSKGVKFLVVYTKEAHPSSGRVVLRNQSDGISLDSHDDEAERMAAAKKAKSDLNLAIPVVLDSMDDAAASKLAGFPNGAVVIDRGGKIVAHQKWTEPAGLRHFIDRALEQE